jgi:hypothetical protein
MKKVILFAAIAGFFFGSCNHAGDKKVEIKDTAQSIDRKAVEASIAVEPMKMDIPKFKSPEARQLADDYIKYVNEYKLAAKNHDAVKLQELVEKQKEWVAKTSEAISKLSPEDTKLWTEYAKKIAVEFAATTNR